MTLAQAKIGGSKLLQLQMCLYLSQFCTKMKKYMRFNSADTKIWLTVYFLKNTPSKYLTISHLNYHFSVLLLHTAKAWEGSTVSTYAAVCWNSNLFDEHSCSQVTKIPKQKTGLLKKGGRWLKVCKFRKQIFLFSFEPKNERNYFLISALRI